MKKIYTLLLVSIFSFLGDDKVFSQCSSLAITSHPSSASRCVNTTVLFQVNATGGTGMTFQWQISTDGGFSFNNLSNASPYTNTTGAGMQISPVSSGMNGYRYRCVVNCSSFSETSNAATLTIYGPPTINSQPKDGIWCTGDNASFSVDATSNGPITYRWYNGTTPLTNDATYSGVTTPNLTITSVQTFMNGFGYKCEIGGCGTVPYSNYGMLTIDNTALTVSGQPANRVICEATNTTFTVTANATTFQWQVNKNDGQGYNSISTNPGYQGVNTKTLTVVGATYNMTGYMYRCYVTKCGSTGYSNSASLTVDRQDGISVHPVDHGVCSGGNTTFFVAAIGTNLTYQWQYHDGSNFVNLANGGIYSTVNSPTLTLTGATAAYDGKRYRCVATGACQMISNEGILTVSTPPIISSQPVSVKACAGNNVNFGLTASGTGLTYQWQTDMGTGNFSNLTNSTTYAAVTTSTMSISGITVGMNGYAYRCKLTSGGCALTSSTATLTVGNTTPSIVNQPSDATVCEGGNKTLSIVANSVVSGLTTYQWQVNSGGGFVNLTNTPPYSNVNTTALTVSATPASISGYSYRCVISTCSYSTTSNAAMITVVPVPVITTQPVEQTICPGSNAVFTVGATGAGLTYQWYSDNSTGGAAGFIVSDGYPQYSNGVIASGATTATLTISGSGAGIGFKFRCLVTGTCNSWPGVSSNTVLLKSASPSLTVNPAPSTICPGGSTTFSVSATGNNLTYQWQIYAAPSYTTLVNSPPYSNVTTATLGITNASAALDNVNYRCVVTSNGTCTVSVNSGFAQLIVNAPFITQHPANTAACTGANASFNVSAAHGVSYQWQEDKNDANGFLNLSASSTYSNVTTASLKIIGATAGMNGYKYRCVVTGACSPTATSNDATLSMNSTTSITIQPGNSSICPGGNTLFTLAAVGSTLTYQWQTDQGTGTFLNITAGGVYSGVNTDSLRITGATAGMNGYNYRCVISGSACSSPVTSSNGTLTILPLPTITTSGASTFCVGNSASLSASGAVSYAWFPSTGLSNQFVSNPVATPYATTTYTVMGTGANSCVNMATVNITVNPLPSVFVSNSSSVCAGQSKTLDAFGASTYVWNPSGSLDNPSAASPVATPSANTTYSVVGTDGNGCSNSAVTSVGIIPLPVVTASGPVTICKGTSTTIGASGAINYVWANTPGLNAYNIAIPVASPAVTSTYTVTGTANSCSNMAFVAVTVNSTPTITVGSSASVVCVGQPSTLTASGASSYVWSPSGSLSDPNISNPVAMPSTATTYSVTGTSANSCTKTTTITVAANPSPVVSCSANASICPGGSTGISASGADSYTWMPGSLPGSGISVSPTSSTTYTVTGSYWAGCSSTATVSVTIRSLPVVTASGAATICMGSSATLNAGGAVSYVWDWSPKSSSNEMDNTAIANPVVTPAGTTAITFTVTGTDAYSCQNTATVSVVANSLPSLTVSGGAGYCIGEGQPTTLTASGAASYVWSPSTDLDNPNISNPVSSTTATITYTVTGTNAGGCSKSGSATIYFYSPNIEITGDTSLCDPTEFVDLTASNATGYLWSAPGCPNCWNTSHINTTAPVTTTYTVTGTSQCVGNPTVTATITVHQYPKPDVQIISSNWVCPDQIAQLDASGAISYIWRGLNLSDTAIANPTAVMDLFDRTYIVFGMDANGCVNSDTTEIFFYSPPFIGVGGIGPLCAGNSVQLEAGGDAVSFSWAPSGGLSAANIYNPVASPSVTTTYTVTGTDIHGCESTTALTVTVNPKPTVVVSADEMSICVGDSVLLHAIGDATSYQWMGGNGVSSPNSANTYAIGNSTGLLTYTAFGYMNGLCPVADSITITVNSFPSISVSGGGAPVCPGTPVPLNALGANTYVWTPDSTLNAGNVSNPTAFPHVSADYTVTGTDANGCSNFTFASISVNPAPNVSILGDNSVCEGDSAFIFANGAESYVWDYFPGIVDPTAMNQAPVPAAITTYNVTGSNANCNVTSFASITVSIKPKPIITVTGSTTVCTGTTVNLNVSGGIMYMWQPGKIVSDSMIANPTATPTVTTVYYGYGINSFNCFSYDSAVVVVNQLPAVAGTASPSTICIGYASTLSASGASTYAWMPGNFSGSPVNASPTAFTSYTVTGTDVNGCTKTNTVSVTVDTAVPTVASAGSDQTVCGSTATLAGNVATVGTGQWTTVSGTAAISNASSENSGLTGLIPATSATLRWTIGNSCAVTSDEMVVFASAAPVVALGPDVTQCSGNVILNAGNAGAAYAWSPSGTTQSITALSTGNYSVIVTDANTCTGTDAIMITLNTPPVVALGPDVTQCGGNVILNAGNAGASYAWSPSATTQSITALSTGNYSVTVTDANTCTGIDDIMVTIHIPPTVNLGADVTQCGGNVTLNAGNAGASYAWFPSGTTQSITASSTGTYSVVVTDVNACTGSDAAMVTINSLPSIITSGNTTMCSGSTSQLTASGGTTYLWQPGGETTTSISVSPTANATYTVTVSDANGCSDISTIDVTVIICTGISAVYNDPALIIYPNPSMGAFTIRSPVAGDFNIVNELGENIRSFKLNAANDYHVNMNGLSNGVYFIIGGNNHQVIRQKVVITR